MDEDARMQQEPKLSIRTLGTGDSAELYSLYMANISQLGRLGAHDARVPVAQQVQEILMTNENRDLFGIFNGTAKLVGVILVRGEGAGHRSAEVGALIDVSSQNKRIGSKALRMVMDAIADRYDHLTAITRDDNILARKSLERDGFKLVSEATDDTQNVVYMWHRKPKRNS